MLGDELQGGGGEELPVAQVRGPLRVGVAEDDDVDRLRVRDDPFELKAPEEEGLIRAGPLLHDAGDAREVEREDGEGQGAQAELPLADREGERAVEGDDERPLRALRLELLQICLLYTSDA